MHGQQNDKYTEMHGQQNDKYTEIHGQQNVRITRGYSNLIGTRTEERLIVTKIIGNNGLRV
jgi:hypothetical protein